uniref:Carboxylic ester hydrolase n=1 Tax=Oryzias melastigma TaxID=30732 RepID=A0A3B3D3U0_ORYME
MMKMMMLVVLLAVCLNSALAAKLGVVQTESGLVEGESIRMSLFRTVDVFKGVPFADVPGKWEKPKPHPGWDGIMRATTYRERCLQVTLLQTKTQGSEDCLYLNIFVPQGLSLSTNLPVMIYLFGGAFLMGASDDVLADRGDVIVVTVNYRVGTLGFLSTGDDRLPGNYGLWDQHAAISWIRRNIAEFGGNPDNLTIFGQSAGAASVSFQMLSPYSRGLFRRAISQSGVALSPWALQRNPIKVTKKIARKVGCLKTDVDEMVTCLKMSDPVELTLAGKIDVLLILGKVIDGDFIPSEPSELFHNAAQFDYLAGINSMDGHFFAGVDVPSINQGAGNTTAEHVEGLLAGLTKEKGDAAIPSAFSVYSVHWGSFPPSDVVKKTVTDIETDFLFLVPTQEALQLHANYSSGARTYSYLFNMKTRIPGFPQWVEANHAEDLQYLFGKPFATPLDYAPRHRDLSQYMISYWSNFARTGDPNSGGNRVPVPWPTFTRNHRPYLVINNSISKSSVRYDLRSYYVNYWTQTYSSL